MPGVPSSNMTSRLYCPKCKSFHLKRLHRGYFRKVVFKQPIQYECRECKAHLSESVIESNEARDVPLFIADR